MKQGFGLLFLGLLSACGFDQADNPGKNQSQEKNQHQEQSEHQVKVLSQALAQARIKSQSLTQALNVALAQAKVQNQALTQALSKAQNRIKIQSQAPNLLQNNIDLAATIERNLQVDACQNKVNEHLVLEDKPLRIKGYPFNSAHLVVYRLNFSDRHLNWSNLNTDLCKTKAYYEKQSYGRFRLSWEIKTVNLKQTTTQFSGRDAFRQWEKLTYEVVSKSGIDPYEPGGNRIVMIASPQVNHYSSFGRYAFLNIFETDKGVGVIAQKMAYAMGLGYAQAIEGGNRVIPFDDDPNDRFPCTSFRNQSRRTHCYKERDAVLQHYGNVYSMMGASSRSLEAFNLLHKAFFNWLDLDQSVPMVRESGIYRFYAYDQGRKDQGYIGLRLRSGNGKYVYWLEHKTQGRFADNAKQGVLINLEGYANNTQDSKSWKVVSYLLDMTPSSKTPKKNDWWANDQTDAALVVGKSYTDRWGGFTVRVLQTGGPKNTAEAWVDVEVKIL